VQRAWPGPPALAVGAVLLAVGVGVGQGIAAGGPAVTQQAVGRPALAAGAGRPTSASDPRVPVAGPVLVPVLLGPAPQPPTAEGASPLTAAGLDDGSTGAPLDPSAVRAALAPLLTGGALGPGRSPAHVIDVATGEVLYDASDDPTVPASTMKLVTATSVLDALGPDHRLRTRAVVVDPTDPIPRVVIAGAGDPSLRSTPAKVGGAGTTVTPASVEGLAASTARALALRGITRVRVGYDASLFSGPALHPSWSRSFPASGIVAPVSALVVDQGRRTPEGDARVADPAARAGRVFAEQLAAAGVAVRGDPKQVQVPGGAETLAYVQSPTIGVLVERMLATSDNDYAEILGRLAAEASGEPASFAGVAERAGQLLTELGVDASGARFADASGLSRSDRLAPSTLTDLLAATSDGYGSIHSGLPVAGATGSLATRFRTADQRPARGVVRAKTGTLTGVGALAGYASRPDGRLLAFGFVDGSAPGGALAARAALDRAAAALVTCECAAP
jgi:serine-type D-Ala-D-Ala carboxypeptidase/endopeptidase (penicillin-binding protein 4)